MRATPLYARVDLWAALLILAAMVSAFPEAAWHWDEYQLAYAIDDFDLNRHQPHPPGYYLFVVAGRVIDTFVGDPFAALRWLSALAVAGFVAMATPRGGLNALPWAAAAALFALLSPLTQRFGVAALSYAAEGALWLGWLLAFARAPAQRRWGYTALAFCGGLAGGVRPTLALWAALMLGGSLVARRAWHSAPALALAGALGVALWWVPLVWESGGWTAYRAAVGPLAAGNVWAKSVFVAGFDGLGSRLSEMGLDLLTSLGGLAAVAAAVAAFRIAGLGVARTAESAASTARLDVLLVGAGIAFGFYALVIYDTPGYLAAVALPLAAWALRSGAGLSRQLPTMGYTPAAGAAVLATAVTALLPAERVAIDYAEHARILEARFAPVRAGFDPSHTALVTSLEYWDYGLRHVAHGLPEFATVQLARDAYFGIADDEKPYLLARGRRIEAIGPDPLRVEDLLQGEALEHVVYMVPFDAQRFITRSCEPLAERLPNELGETLVVLATGSGSHAGSDAGWTIEARAGRLYCAPANAVRN